MKQQKNLFSQNDVLGETFDKRNKKKGKMEDHHNVFRQWVYFLSNVNYIMPSSNVTITFINILSICFMFFARPNQDEQLEKEI